MDSIARMKFSQKLAYFYLLIGVNEHSHVDLSVYNSFKIEKSGGSLMLNFLMIKNMLKKTIQSNFRYF